MASLSATTTTSCQASQGLITLTALADAPGAESGGTYTWTVINQATTVDYGGAVGEGDSVSVPDGTYQVRVYGAYPSGATATSTPRTHSVACGGNSGGGGGGTGTGGGGTGGGGTTPPSPIVGCQDPYADNYDPAATSAGTCTYTPRWRGAWGPAGVAVRVAAVAGQTEAFVTAVLRAGFRAGHPLAASRPLADVATLRATVGPDGYATFVLGPFLRPLLGAPDGAGGYRLDLNSPTAYQDDLYVGYELRRSSSTGALLEHGYVLNAAVPDSSLAAGTVLSAFATVPTWPGYAWQRVKLSSRSAGAYGALDSVTPTPHPLPCPPNPLPVAWLNPLGGWDFFVFQGRSVLGDSITEGQTYQEASSGQLRYSDPGQARRTVRASSGVFRGDALLEGLRTLWRSPQVWYQPVPEGEWVPIVVERGSREVGRLGVLRNELQLSFSVAQADYVQGQ